MIKDSDFIFEDEEEPKKQVELDFEEDNPELLEGKLQPEDKVLVNSIEFTINEFVKAKEVGDSLGFPAIYYWYKATDDEGNKTNLFYYDDDIDCKEDNDLVAEEWFNTYMEDN